LVGSNDVVRNRSLVASEFSHCIIGNDSKVDDKKAAITSIEETDPVPACVLDFVLWPDVSIDNKVVAYMRQERER
jgi:hypothetical protein